MNFSKIASLFFFLAGVVYTILAVQLPAASIGRPQEPKVFPIALGVLTIILSIALLLKEFRAETSSKKSDFDFENMKKIGLTAICAFLYAILFDRIGYVLATILFLEGVLCVFNGMAKWKQNTIISVIFSVVVYVLFFNLLNVYLPPLPFFE